MGCAEVQISSTKHGLLHSASCPIRTLVRLNTVIEMCLGSSLMYIISLLFLRNMRFLLNIGFSIQRLAHSYVHVYV